MKDKCSFIGCREDATIILIHPVTKLFVESCHRHLDQVKGILTSGRRTNKVVYEQKSLERSY